MVLLRAVLGQVLTHLPFCPASAVPAALSLARHVMTLSGSPGVQGLWLTLSGVATISTVVKTFASWINTKVHRISVSFQGKVYDQKEIGAAGAGRNLQSQTFGVAVRSILASLSKQRFLRSERWGPEVCIPAACRSASGIKLVEHCPRPFTPMRCPACFELLSWIRYCKSCVLKVLLHMNFSNFRTSTDRIWIQGHLRRWFTPALLHL